MTDKELLYIITIAEKHNITHAAECLRLAQPSLTQCLKRIEFELGCPLFIRRKYGLDLTQEGELYVAMAKDILNRKQRFHNELMQLQNSQFSHLSLGASWYNTLLFFSDIIPDVNVDFPNIIMNLVEKRTHDLIEQFNNHKLDLILTHEYPKNLEKSHRFWSKDVEFEKLLDEKFVLVAHKKFVLSSSSSTGTIDLKILEKMPFISFNEDQRIRRITDSAFESAGIITKKVVMTQSFPGAMELARRGVGLAVLPTLYVHRNLSSKNDLICYAIPEPWNAYWSTFAYYKKSTCQKQEIQEVLFALRKISRKLKYEINI